MFEKSEKPELDLSAVATVTQVSEKKIDQKFFFVGQKKSRSPLPQIQKMRRNWPPCNLRGQEQ